MFVAGQNKWGDCIYADWRSRLYKGKKILEHIEIIRSIPSDARLNDEEHLSSATNFSRVSCFLAEVITKLQKDSAEFLVNITLLKEDLQQIIKRLSKEKLNFALVKTDNYEKKFFVCLMNIK